MRSILFSMFSPFGRLSRVQFLAGFGLLMFLGPALTLVLTVFFQATAAPASGLSRYGLVASPIYSITLFASAWVIYCLFVNRLHDINRTGAWALIPAVLPVLGMGLMTSFSSEGLGWGAIMAMFISPILYAGTGLLLLCFSGDAGPNRFGDRPILA